jgi:hypothetical protein
MKRKLLLYGLIRVTRRENHDKSNTSMALRGAEFGKMGKKEPFRGQKSRTPVACRWTLMIVSSMSAY